MEQKSDSTYDEDALLQKLAAVQSVKAKKIQRKILTALLVLVLLGGGSWFGWNYYQQQQLSGRVPADIRSELDFPIYIPSADYQIDPKGYETSAGILSFSARRGSSQFTFTEQSMPADFELSRYTSGIGISEAKELTVPAGHALLGKVLGRTILIVATKQTLITVTSTNSSSATESLASTLVKTN